MRTEKWWSARSTATVAFAFSIFLAGAATAPPVRANSSRNESATSVSTGAAAAAVESNGGAVAKANYGTAVQNDSAITAALCQVVYPLDATQEDGYRYMFFGNGFFVNDQGYIVTAAHLLGYFRNGGIPYILVGPPEGPRQMIEAPIVAADWDHDVAVLRASPNPFETDKKIAYLRVSPETLVRGNAVLSASLRPLDVQNAHSSLAPLQDFSRGQVLDYLFYRDKSTEDPSELMLFNENVVPGQSGSPLISASTHEVVGVVVGKWLHPAVVPTDANGGHTTMAPGAALRIHYAIGLLEQLHVAWNTSPSAAPAGTDPTTTTRAPVLASNLVAESPEQPATTPAPARAGAQAPAAAATDTPAAQQPSSYTPPAPLSVVGVPYPPQALFGGNVFLDALVDADGKLNDVRVVNGDAPFLDVALDAVRTWTFSPAHVDGRAVESRIGIVFQFPQSFLPGIVPKERNYKEPLADAGARGALPLYTLEPVYPINTVAEGSVVLYGRVDPDGQLTSLDVLRNVDALTNTTGQAVQRWKWAPGKQAGTNVESTVIIVDTFRRPTD